MMFEDVFTFFFLCVYVVTANSIILRDVNLVVVTDTHSWLSGHKHVDHSPISDASYGTLYDFILHMKELSHNQRKDVFFLDNGDLVDGTGLSNVTPRDGEALFPLLKDLPFDALNIGNHELYSSGTVEALQSTGFIKYWNGSYLTSNTVYAKSRAPLGSKYTVLRGKYGTNLLVFGFLYDMNDHCDIVDVEKVENVIQLNWFKNALLSEKYDAIVILAHMHATDPLVYVILRRIRMIVGNSMIIQFLTGHSHVRQYHPLDSRASSFEAGKYYDTIGYIAFDIPKTMLNHSIRGTTFTSDVILEHKFLNANKKELIQFLNLNENTFPTLNGKLIDMKIDQVRELLGLKQKLGCSLVHFESSCAIEEDNSLWKLYITQVIPNYLLNPPLNQSQVLFQSTGSFRYDLYNGDVYVDDIWTFAPFSDSFHSILNIPGYALKKLFSQLNNEIKSVFDPTIRSPIKSYLPHYVASQKVMDMNDQQLYDLLCVGFDKLKLIEKLESILGRTVSYHSFRPDVNDTSVWFSWAKENLLPGDCNARKF